MNAQAIRILRSESSEIDAAFNHAERVSRQRARIEQGMTKIRDKLGELKKLETQAFHDAVEMVAGG